jgi:hypothetical protein
MLDQMYLLGRQGALHYQEQAGASPEVSNEDNLGSLKLWLELGKELPHGHDVSCLAGLPGGLVWHFQTGEQEKRLVTAIKINTILHTHSLFIVCQNSR